VANARKHEAAAREQAEEDVQWQWQRRWAMTMAGD